MAVIYDIISKNVSSHQATFFYSPFDHAANSTNASFEILFTSAPNSPYVYHVPPALVILLHVVIFVTAFVGNATVILVVIKKRRMQTYTNWLILNLAVSDLAVSSICIPFHVPLVISGRWVYGAFFCVIYYPLGTATLLSSVFTLVTLTISRYWAITHPFKETASILLAKKLICIIWLFSFVLIIPIMAVLKYDKKYNICYEKWDGSARLVYNMIIFVIGYVLPLMIIIIAHTLIIYEISMKSKSKALSYRDKYRLKENKQLVKLSFVIAITFGVCILPTNVVWLYLDFGDASRYKYIADLKLGSHLLLFMNSMLNPIIYNVFSTRFRNGLATLLKDSRIILRKMSGRSISMMRKSFTGRTISDNCSYEDTSRNEYHEDNF